MSDSAQRTLRTILTGMPGILALKNKKLVYEVVNPQFCQFLGKAMDEIAGKTDEQLFPAPDAAAAGKEQKSVLNSGISRRVELQLSGKDGAHFFDVTLSAVLDENGDPDGVMLAGHDVTVFKQREAAVAGAEARVAEAEERAAVATEKLRQIHEEAKTLEAAAQQQQDHLKQREKQLAQTLKQTGILEGQVKEAQDALQAAHAQLAEAIAARTKAEQALGTAESTLASAQATAAAAEGRVSAAEAAASEAAARVSALEGEAAGLRQRQADAATLARQLAEKLG